MVNHHEDRPRLKIKKLKLIINQIDILLNRNYHEKNKIRKINKIKINDDTSC